jgi:alkanesulfonate monooxygenase SsuD/methylene tetrahydromethanopterin reductase-like flavin-dependent oxidoreductase (luciferase family)
MATLQRGLAVPCFAEDPMELARLGIEAERAGFDGFFLWDHMVFSNTGDGPPIVDPWLVLAVVAASTSRIRLGTMITPVPRRRPWQLARETTTLDRLSNGRLILGVGIGSPAYGDFGIFHEPSGERERAELLDEGLDVLAGLWSGEKFSYQGSHFTVDPVRFTPTPVQRPRIPVWVGGVLPAARPIARAARWDGMVPIRFAGGSLVRPSAEDIAGTAATIAAARGASPAPAGSASARRAAAGGAAAGPTAGPAADYDMVVWAEIAAEPAEVPEIAVPYQASGVTWWIETAKPEPRWWEGVQERVARGVPR